VGDRIGIVSQADLLRARVCIEHDGAQAASIVSV
jgi:hypothetical protein